MNISEEKVLEKYHDLTTFLIARHLTITAMESATGGMIASLITDTEGSSAVLKGSFVTYSNEAKILQGVPAEVIDRYSVYSEETAQAMAQACRKTYQADIGIGVTGTLGNLDPDNAAASVPGEVYYAIDLPDGTHSFHREIPLQKDRFHDKMVVAEMVCDDLMGMYCSQDPLPQISPVGSVGAPASQGLPPADRTLRPSVLKHVCRTYGAYV